ncbi:uncharacterized protein LOC126761360 [Bactrocera neohumeralis]|uniref:uncharacterized protein LOC126761360 n=1 Tax=Bactrocera neohumeralis TaxID=98809 RepID=UPI00216600AB|nr:uncharacterized protein LOC126761360 [Bactrocera neohumeralis]
MEWTRERTLTLINEYRKRRGLWDMTHDDYRKKDIKQNLLMEVSNSLGGSISVNEIEKKFHTLRTQYHREINRMNRKEPYNSKWFGFKNLQFLSSPMARRLSRGRIKNEITEDGTVTPKYIIRDSNTHHDSSGSSVNLNNNVNEEFLIHQKSAIAIEPISNSKHYRNTSRSRALEKLIEETTKDIDEADDKQKMTITMEQQCYNNEMQVEDQMNSHRINAEGDEEQLEAIQLQEEEEEITYTSSTGADGCDISHNQQTISTRIIKAQHNNSCNDQEIEYEDEADPSHEDKRVFYSSTGQQNSVPITSTPSAGTHPTNILLNSKIKISSQQKQHLPGRNLDKPTNPNSGPQVFHTSGHIRDEYTTYGEYVSNEMRNITNREVLLGLKHKINTALFEAQMAELRN